jgi:pimeloyl-ACP methyl ester carboxylesterase
VNALRRLLRVALISAIALAQLGAIGPQKAAPYDVGWYLTARRSIDVGGRRLNIVCSGSGSPTVVLEAGLLADSAAWRFVQPSVSQKTRVCSYDRAGLGFSDPAGAPRDAAAIVRDLHALLANAAIGPPFILVGWSSGGVYARLYQYRYPRDVAGLVEVDPDSEFTPDDYDASIVMALMHVSREWYDAQIASWYKQFDNCAANVARGSCAFFPGGLAAYRARVRSTVCRTISDPACALALARGEHLARASLWKDEALELKATPVDAAELRAARRPYGNLPLIVLTDSERGDVDSDGPLTAAAQRAEWAAKNAAHERMARLSTVGAHFVVAGSSHIIPIDNPSAVICAVDEVLDQARRDISSPRGK